MIKIEIQGGSLKVQMGNLLGITARVVADRLRRKLEENGVSARVQVVSKSVVKVYPAGFKGLFQDRIAKEVEKGLAAEGVRVKVTLFVTTGE